MKIKRFGKAGSRFIAKLKLVLRRADKITFGSICTQYRNLTNRSKIKQSQEFPNTIIISKNYKMYLLVYKVVSPDQTFYL